MDVFDFNTTLVDVYHKISDDADEGFDNFNTTLVDVYRKLQGITPFNIIFQYNSC